MLNILLSGSGSGGHIYPCLALYNYLKNIKYIYNRFLLEKYLYKTKYKNKKIINNYNKMYRNTNHIIKNNKKYLKEEDFLSKLFD